MSRQGDINCSDNNDVTEENLTSGITTTYRNDPYGKSSHTSGPLSNPFQFTGALLDSSTGLYKMGERYYDPGIGRFTQEDSAGRGYSYVGGNLMNEVDAAGLAPEKTKGSEHTNNARPSTERILQKGKKTKETSKLAEEDDDAIPFCSRRNSRRETTRLVRNPSRACEALLRRQQTGLVLPVTPLHRSPRWDAFCHTPRQSH